MVKPGKVTESREEETEEYNSGPYKWPHRRQYTDPNTFHIMSNLVSFPNSPPYVNKPKLINAITDTSFLVISNYDESNSCGKVVESGWRDKISHLRF